MKNVLLCQWAIFQLTLWNWLFPRIVRWVPTTALMRRWFWHIWPGCYVWHHMSLCTHCPYPLCNKVWEHPECNKHPLTTSLGICHSLLCRITVCKPWISIWETHGTFPTLLLSNFHSSSILMGVGFNTLLSKSWSKVSEPSLSLLGFSLKLYERAFFVDLRT